METPPVIRNLLEVGKKVGRFMLDATIAYGNSRYLTPPAVGSPEMQEVREQLYMTNPEEQK